MLLFHSIGIARIGDTILFAVHAADLWLLAFCTLLLGVASVALARIPQPIPGERSWATREAMKRHPSARR